MKAEVKTYVATIGFFDGVHRGHQFLIRQVREEAAARGMQSMVVTFPVHPRRVLHSDYQPQLLTTRSEKQQLLEQSGVSRLAWLDFSPAMARMTARDFMQMLYADYGVRVLMVGYDHRFGHGRTDGFADYVRYGRELGMEVLHAEELPGGVSSTTVRNALLQGDVRTANETLGYPFFLEGRVVHGFHNGTGMGFPTANLQVEADKLMPMNGAYCVKVSIAAQGARLGDTKAAWRSTPKAQRLPGMLNIGHRPTLRNGTQRSVEVHIFDFCGDLYDCRIRLEFVDFLRAERQFLSVEELRRQLMADEAACRKLMTIGR